MTNDELIEKKIRVKFCNLSSADEQRIRRFINSSVLKKDAQVNESMIKGAIQRSDVRIDLDRLVRVDAAASKSLEARSFKARISDISSGGLCLRVDEHLKFAKNGKLKMYLYFIEEGFVVEGEILGLKPIAVKKSS
ncbi:MAG: PilZ domain-containing protein [Pseudomonadota bacterium]